MMKFFRKHNKKLLSVFMVALMVVFLGGGALNSLLTPNINRVVASSALGDISWADSRITEETYSILAAMRINAQFPVVGMTEPLETIDWILLTREAQRLGMMPTAPMLEASSLLQALGVDNLARMLQKKRSRIVAALAEFSGIRTAASTVAGAASPSEAEIQSAARKVLEKVQVAAVVLPAQVFIDDTAEPDESELVTQFETYRERERGAGLDLGYYVPPALKIEYIKIDRHAIAGQVRAANLDRKARTYYDDQRESDPAFLRPKSDDKEEDAEGPPLDEPPYLTWEEARETAIAAVRLQESDRAASRIVDWLLQFTANAWFDTERGEDGYRVPPAEVTDPAYFASVAGDIPQSLAYPDAVTVGTTDFFTTEEARDVPVLGGASFTDNTGRTILTLETLVFRSKPIVPKVPDAKTVNPADYVAPFQTSRYALTDQDGNRYVVRVIDSRPGHVAESIDEVRDKVVADWRLLRAYDTALARAESLRSCSPAVGLAEAFESDEELLALTESLGGAAGYTEPAPFGRAGRGQAMSPTPVDKVYVGGSIGFLPVEAVDQCFSLQDVETKVGVIELKDRATVIIARWIETQKPNGNEFGELRQQLAETLTQRRQQAAIADWLKPDNVRARNRFAFVTDQ